MAAPGPEKEDGRKGDPFSFVAPPDFLKHKVVKGRGVDLSTVEERAEALVTSLKAEYLERVQEQLDGMERMIRSARDGAGPDRGATLEALSRVSHEIKGQAGTFGFELITTIGTSLCDYVEDAADPGADDITVAEIHVNAMRVVVTDNIRGDGGKVGRQLLAGMSAMVAKMRRR